MSIVDSNPSMSLYLRFMLEQHTTTSSFDFMTRVQGEQRSELASGRLNRRARSETPRSVLQLIRLDFLIDPSLFYFSER